jgi:ricin-type beta-trefoil lectin protein
MIRHSSRLLGTCSLAFAAATLSGCAAPDDDLSSEDVSAAEISYFGNAEQFVSAACGGDDSNALTAALAVAIANELGRWDVSTDFQVTGGKLELSATGKLHCGSGCANITALLRLQDDASSVIKNHVPATYRTKLTTWYNEQKTALTNLVGSMLKVEQGVFRIRSSLSGKYIVPQNGSTTAGAVLEQSDQYSSTTAAQWSVSLNGTRQQLKNVKSGLCMDLSSDTANSTTIVQRACNGGATQDFRLGQLDAGLLTIRSKHNKAFMPQSNSTANGADIVQNTVIGATAEKFAFEAAGSGAHRDLLETITAAYSLKVAHTGMGFAVQSSSVNDGVPVVQQPYVASDDRFHWYITQIGTVVINNVTTTTYQFQNRLTGKCMDLNGTSIVQRTCSTAQTQRFTLAPTGNYRQVAYSSNGKPVGVMNGSSSSGAAVGEAGSAWEMYNMVTYEPLIAIEPHRLTYNRKETGGPCGNYYWYDVKQPNGVALKKPSETYVQLMFAGGKKTPTGADVNPFIAQKVAGNQVAIDPTYGLNEAGSSSSGSCAASCLKVSTSNVAGQCCSCNSVTAKFAKSTWNASTFICQ